jgi:hypothetical protein
MPLMMVKSPEPSIHVNNPWVTINRLVVERGTCRDKLQLHISNTTKTLEYPYRSDTIKVWCQMSHNN